MNDNLSQDYGTAISLFLQPILEQGQEGILSAMRILLNEAMLIERSNALNAKPYERSEHRIDYAEKW